MDQIIIKSRRIGQSEAEAMLIKNILLTGATPIRACKNPPNDLISRLKKLGVKAAYEPVYVTSRFEFLFSWLGEVIGTKKRTKRLLGYKIYLKQ